MFTSASVLVLASLSFVSSLDPFTYSIHASCLDRPGDIFPKGIAAAKETAMTALSMLQDPNTGYHTMVFRILFKTEPQGAAGEAVTDRLKEIFSALVDMKEIPSPDPEIVPARRIYDNDLKGNYRFFCDEDSLNGLSRWRLRPDLRRSQRPRGYIPNAKRPKWPLLLKNQYQEWWDPANKIMMGPTRGCQTHWLKVASVTYDPTPIWASYPGYPREMMWTTTTFCKVALKSSLMWSLDNLPADFDFGTLRDPMTVLLGVTSSNIMHEFCHFPPWKLQDIKSPHFNETKNRLRSYRWEDVLDIPGTWNSLKNVNNVVMYAILARMEVLGWRLSTEIDELRRGTLYRWKP